MRITSVTIGFGLTESLPDYGNVKPAARLTADIEPGCDNVREVIDRLDRLARAYCEDAVDMAREMEGLKPKYFKGPLFRLCLWKQRGAVVIVPEDVVLDNLPGTWKVQGGRMRLETARRRADRLEAQGREVLVFDHAEITIWWNEREWYGIYSLRIWESRWDYNVGQVVCVRHGLAIHDDMGRINVEPQSLDALLSDLQQSYKESEWAVIEDQESLDKLVARWLIEHPVPV